MSSMRLLDPSGMCLNETDDPRSAVFGRSLFFEASLPGKNTTYQLQSKVTFANSENDESDDVPEYCYARLTSDSSGQIPLTCIWPQLGFEDLANAKSTEKDYRHFRKKWTGAKIEFTLTRQGGSSPILTETIYVDGDYSLIWSPPEASGDLTGKQASSSISVEFKYVLTEPTPRFRVIVTDAAGSQIDYHDHELGKNNWDSGTNSRLQRQELSLTNETITSIRKELAELTKLPRTKYFYHDNNLKPAEHALRHRITRLLLTLSGRHRPVMFHTNRQRELVNGFHARERDLMVFLDGFTASRREIEIGSKLIKLFVIPYQFDRRNDDEIHCVVFNNTHYTEASITESGEYLIPIAEKGMIEPNRYDFVARLEPYRASTNTTSKRGLAKQLLRNRLNPGDAYTQGCPGVVISERPRSQKLRNDASSTPWPHQFSIEKIALIKLHDAPYFNFTHAISRGDDLYGAAAPSAIVKSSTTKFVQFFVIPHESIHEPRTQSSSGSRHVDENNRTVIVNCQMQTGHANPVLLWPGASASDDNYAYDLIAHYPEGASSISEEIPALTQNCFVDGIHKPGVRLVIDPANYRMRRLSKINSLEYSSRHEVDLIEDFPEPGSEEKSTFFPTKNARLRGIVYFPATRKSGNENLELDANNAPYPLVVVAHGLMSENLRSYQGFDYLLEHLAWNGFVAASIFLPETLGPVYRAALIAEHIHFLQEKFGRLNFKDQKIGLIGHSRSGTAIATALRLNALKGKPGGGHPDVPQFFEPFEFGSVVALAPSDEATRRGPERRQRLEELHFPRGAVNFEKPLSIPNLFIIYGSLDTATDGLRVTNGEDRPGESGFTMFDRAREISKGMIYVSGATHFSFNRELDPRHKLDTNDEPRLISALAHEAVVKAYVNAVMSLSLRREKRYWHWNTMIRGDWISPAVSRIDDGKIQIASQFREHKKRRIEIPIDPGSPENFAITPRVMPLHKLENWVPHSATGLKLNWKCSSDDHTDAPRYSFNVTIPSLPIINHYLSFRVGRTYDLEERWNRSGAPQDLFVGLLFETEDEPRLVRASDYAKLFAPFEREEKDPGRFLIKAPLITARIPISAFVSESENNRELEIAKVVFEFSATERGELMLTDIEFAELRTKFPD